PQHSILDQVLGNPLILGGLALILLLLILLAVRSRRNKAAAAEQAEAEAADFGEDDFGADDDFLPALASDEDDDAPLMTDDEPAEPEQDPLEQADVFIAYGQYPQALSYLRSAINAEPARIDLK